MSFKCLICCLFSAENCVRLPYILVTAEFTGLIKGFIYLAIDYLLNPHYIYFMYRFILNRTKTG